MPFCDRVAACLTTSPITAFYAALLLQNNYSLESFLSGIASRHINTSLLQLYICLSFYNFLFDFRYIDTLGTRRFSIALILLTNIPFKAISCKSRQNYPTVIEISIYEQYGCWIDWSLKLLYPRGSKFVFSRCKYVSHDSYVIVHHSRQHHLSHRAAVLFVFSARIPLRSVLAIHRSHFLYIPAMPPRVVEMQFR